MLSVWTTGLEQAKTLFHLFLSLKTGLGSDPNQLQFVVPLQKMMNLHGLIYGMAEGHIGLRSITLLTFILSAGFLFWVALASFSLRRDDQFKMAVASAVVVSYYMFVHYLVISPDPAFAHSQ